MKIDTVVQPSNLKLRVLYRCHNIFLMTTVRISFNFNNVALSRQRFGMPLAASRHPYSGVSHHPGTSSRHHDLLVGHNEAASRHPSDRVPHNETASRHPSDRVPHNETASRHRSDRVSQNETASRHPGVRVSHDETALRHNLPSRASRKKAVLRHHNVSSAGHDDAWVSTVYCDRCLELVGNGRKSFLRRKPATYHQWVIYGVENIIILFRFSIQSTLIS